MALRRGRPVGESRSILIGSIIPAGTIAPFGGGTVPEGWLLCDGSIVSRATYDGLFAAGRSLKKLVNLENHVRKKKWLKNNNYIL